MRRHVIDVTCIFDSSAGALMALPLRLQLDVLLDRSLPFTFVTKRCMIEGLVPFEHVVDGPAELVGQDRERLGLAVLLLEPLA